MKENYLDSKKFKLINYFRSNTDQIWIVPEKESLKISVERVFIRRNAGKARETYIKRLRPRPPREK